MQEIFNKRLDQIIEGLKGVAKSTDDFLVHGRNKQEHDMRLRALLQRLAAHWVTLNTKKCLLRTTHIDFLGHHVSTLDHWTVKLMQLHNSKHPQT